MESLIQAAKNRRKKGSSYELSIEEIERYNPGKFTLGWVSDEGETSSEIE